MGESSSGGGTRRPAALAGVGVAVVVGVLSLAAVLLARAALDAPPDRPEEGVVSLAASIEPLGRAFDAAADRPRLVAVMSTTCPTCREGALAVVDALAATPSDVAALVVWTRVLPKDGDRVRYRRGLVGSDPRVAQFHDSERRAATAIGRALGWPGDGPAWDVYLVYPPGVRWGGAPPAPAAWFQQHRDLGDPARFRRPKALAADLTAALAALGAAG